MRSGGHICHIAAGEGTLPLGKRPDPNQKQNGRCKTRPKLVLSNYQRSSAQDLFPLHPENKRQIDRNMVRGIFFYYHDILQCTGHLMTTTSTTTTTTSAGGGPCPLSVALFVGVTIQNLRTVAPRYRELLALLVYLTWLLCSTRFVFGLIISHRNFVSLDSCLANGARFLPETPRSRFDDCRCQGLGRVGEMKQDEGEEW